MAHVELIASLSPINGADRIELAKMENLGWQVVVKKGEFNVGDKIVYIEIDSVVPADNPYFEFMADRKYRVKTIKLRQTLSQGLIVPMSVLPNLGIEYKVGQDVTEILGVKKYDEYGENNANADVSEEMSERSRLKNRYGKLYHSRWFKYLLSHKWIRKILLPRKKSGMPTGWPSFMPKTDEERIENCPYHLNDQEVKWIRTIKMDGTSSSFAVRKTWKGWETWVCSRNVVQKSPDHATFFKEDSNVYWDMEKKYDILNKLKDYCKRNKCEWAYFQGESCGPKLQGNRMGLPDRRCYMFNFVDSRNGRWESDKASTAWTAEGLLWVPILDSKDNPYTLPSTIEEMKKSVEDLRYCYQDMNNDLAEGLVYRSLTNPVMSFKNVSNAYLLKHKI